MKERGRNGGERECVCEIEIDREGGKEREKVG